MAKQRSTSTAVRLKDTLILNKFILNLFGVESFESFAKDLKGSRLEGYDENNISLYYKELIAKRFSNELLKKDQLLEYDQNIYSHTKQISEKQHKPIIWKYFQYLSLLFTEVYLDLYFSNQSKLLESINAFIDELNSSGNDYTYPKYQLSDLNKLAYWNATGSGKTLIMHINILQYFHYAGKHKKIKDLNRVILLTPNEGLSKQHLTELHKSGFNAELFTKQNTPLFSGKLIEIIDIHKLEEKEGEKTVAVDSFESNNLVLVDEGHRGASGEDWKDKRNRLCENGFSFEYSATFSQAVSAANGTKRKNLLNEYSKCIIFDYSYKYFNKDGYGKDYRIFNLNITWSGNTFDLYLAACLLNYYQQLKVYEDQYNTLRPFLIEKPLFVFVGSKVTAIRIENGNTVSDVIRILQFLSGFIKNRAESIDAITRLINSKDELLDNRHQQIFSNSFAYLISRQRQSSEIYDDLLKRVFNASFSGAELHLDNLKGADGEIGLRVGNSEYFGVINVGDDAKLMKLCEDNGFLTRDKEFSDSLFHNINEKNSSINILIGSKKFSEGWNSWRVSTMGLMNVGRGEGTEIIQLFGRGVRLKGYNFSLKRSSELDIDIKPESIPNEIKYLEKLFVFGIRADYMQQFKEYLDEEGLSVNDSNYEELSVSVWPAIEILNSSKLKILKVKDGVDFKKDIELELYRPSGKKHLHIKVDWYPRIQVLQKSAKQNNLPNDIRQEGKLIRHHLAFVNWDKVYFEIQKFKSERDWYNLNVKKTTLMELFNYDDWYTLLIPPHELEFNSFEQTFIWQEAVIALLKRYCDRVYNYERNKYLSRFLEYGILDPSNPNFIDEYKFYIEKTKESLIEKIKELKNLVETKEFKDRWEFSSILAFEFSQHLYKPLLHFSSSFGEILKVSPVQLWDSEKDFVNDLKCYYELNAQFFEDKELFLLRNTSRNGVGFFVDVNNFYPDFILWLIDKEKQHISFIDPKGLRQVNGFKNPKINFHAVLKKEIEPKLKEQEPDITLNSFIVTPTKLAELDFWQDGKTLEDFAKHNVYFQKEDKNYIKTILEKILN